MKQLSIIILALLMLLQSFSKAMVYFSFKINQKNIAQTLCVKKEIKNNDCQGTCLLKKQLENSNENKEKHPLKNQQDKAESLYCFKLPVYNLIRTIALDKTKYLNVFISEFNPSKVPSEVFHPPEFR